MVLNVISNGCNGSHTVENAPTSVFGADDGCIYNHGEMCFVAVGMLDAGDNNVDNAPKSVVGADGGCICNHGEMCFVAVGMHSAAEVEHSY
jgi:hypothetical protein